MSIIIFHAVRQTDGRTVKDLCTIPNLRRNAKRKPTLFVVALAKLSQTMDRRWREMSAFRSVPRTTHAVMERYRQIEDFLIAKTRIDCVTSIVSTHSVRFHHSPSSSTSPEVWYYSPRSHTLATWDSSTVLLYRLA